MATPSALAEFYRRQLFEDCLPFWFPRMADEQHGGFVHCFDRDGTLVDSDKSVWAQGRTSWMLLTLYLGHERRGEWLAWAESGLRFLEDKCVDPADGRMYFHVARDGTPIRKRRYAYSESFAAIAFAAHAAATGSDASAAKARRWFDHFTKWNFTPGLMPAKHTEARPLEALTPRLITLVTAQELRRHLGGDASLDAWIDRALGDIARLFVRPEHRAVLEVVTPEGAVSDHFDGRVLSPGHAIEAAWFVLLEARLRGDAGLRELGCRMLDWMWERGWDREYGGLFYFRDVYNTPIQEYWHDMKFWWPHDEALIATLLAYQMTGEPRYLAMHDECRAWSFKHFADAEHGEWYGYLHRDGTPSSTLKGSLWKSFFHHPRALWMCHSIARDMEAPAVAADGGFGDTRQSGGATMNHFTERR